ncbi:hypothetical protein IWQ61_007100 [Dispira simplex]|nr:hypothetical protein IWQ61_007100 [Dispira simplex]
MSLAFSGVLPSIRLQSLAPRLVWDDDKVYGIQILAKRTGFTKFFVGFVLFCVWLTALGLPMAVIIAGIRRDRTALGYTLIYGLGFLCLCPILRTLFPGAPPLGSLAVVLGLLWPVVISVLTLALGIHLWWIHNWSPKAPLISVLDGSMDLGKNPYPAAALKDPKHPLLSEFVLPHPAQPVPGLSSSQAILPTLPKDTNKLSPYSKGYQKLGSSRG